MKSLKLFAYFFLTISTNLLSASDRERFQVPSDSQALKADLVIFSYNRPLQLYALLESIALHVKNFGEIHVIYRSSEELFAKGYDEVKVKFPDIKYISQGANPREDFKPLTIEAVYKSPNPYVIFAVDDIIVKDSIDLNECITLLENTEAYGFFLRLGKNLSECYALKQNQPVPTMLRVDSNVFAWSFALGGHDWNYPHTVDMTLYRKKDIEPLLTKLSYSAPNTLEGYWASNAKEVMPKFGLCYENSKIVNVPLNIVQTEIAPNRNMNFLSVEKLLAIFLVGLKMDIKQLFKIDNKAAHMAYEPSFIVR